MSSDSPISLTRVFDRGLSVITSFISSFVLIALLQPTSYKLEFTLTVVLVFVLWMIMDGMIREWLNNISSLKRNKNWKEVLVSGIDFISLLFIFLMVQLFLTILTEGWNAFNPSVPEALVAIFVVILTALAIFQTIKSYEKSDDME